MTDHPDPMVERGRRRLADPFGDVARSHDARAAARTARRAQDVQDDQNRRLTASADELETRYDAEVDAELDEASTSSPYPVAFQVVRDSWEEIDGRPVRVIHEIKLLSVSIDHHPGPHGLPAPHEVDND